MAQPKWLGLARPLFKKNPKNFQKSLKKYCDFSRIFFQPIMHNIRLYFDTIKYKFGIKIPGFSPKYFNKKNQNIFKKEKKYFIAYDQILKFFQACFS